MAVYPFQFVNRRGSAAISTSGVTVNTANVVFSFPNHAFVNAWYRGTIYIDIAQAVPTGTTGTLPVLFETNGATQAVTKYNGEALTAGDTETCNIIVKVLLEMIKSPEDIHILQSCKNRLIGLLSMVNEKEKIIKYNELVSVIARLGTKPRDNKQP